MFSITLALVLQLWFAALALAAPAVTIEANPPWQYGTGGGILGFIVLVLDIIVWSELKSPCFILCTY